MSLDREARSVRRR